jgi:hypothetical protein
MSTEPEEKDEVEEDEVEGHRLSKPAVSDQLDDSEEDEVAGHRLNKPA